MAIQEHESADSNRETSRETPGWDISDRFAEVQTIELAFDGVSGREGSYRFWHEGKAIAEADISIWPDHDRLNQTVATIDGLGRPSDWEKDEYPPVDQRKHFELAFKTAFQKGLRIGGHEVDRVETELVNGVIAEAVIGVGPPENWRWRIDALSHTHEGMEGFESGGITTEMAQQCLLEGATIRIEYYRPLTLIEGQGLGSVSLSESVKLAPAQEL